MAKNKYNFTPQTFDKCNHEHFLSLVDELSKFNPTTPWENIREGDVYHFPDLILYKRADFIVCEIMPTYINGMIRDYETMEWKNYSLFKNEVRAKFMVKKLPLRVK